MTMTEGGEEVMSRDLLEEADAELGSTPPDPVEKAGATLRRIHLWDMLARWEREIAQNRDLIDRGRSDVTKGRMHGIRQCVGDLRRVLGGGRP